MNEEIESIKLGKLPSGLTDEMLQSYPIERGVSEWKENDGGWISLDNKKDVITFDGKEVKILTHHKGCFFDDDEMEGDITHYMEIPDLPLKSIVHDCPNHTDGYTILREKRNGVEYFNIFDGDSPYLCGVTHCPWCGGKSDE